MKYLFFFVALLISSYVFSDGQYSSREEYLQSMGLSDSCDLVKNKINNEASDVLVVIYYLGVEFRCFKKNNPKVKKELIIKKWSEYSDNINDVFEKKFNFDNKYNFDLVEINLRQPWNVKNNEKIKKYYIKNILKKPPFDETGEHPFKPEVFVFDQYKDISGAYFAEGMEKEGERVIQELSELPHQSKGKIQDLRNEMKDVYQSWKSKQDSKDKKDEVDEKIKQDESAAPKKPAPVVSTVKKQPVVKAEEQNKKDKVLQETNNKQLVIIGIAIGILVLIGFMLARRKNNQNTHAKSQ